MQSRVRGRDLLAGGGVAQNANRAGAPILRAPALGNQAHLEPTLAGLPGCDEARKPCADHDEI